MTEYTIRNKKILIVDKPRKLTQNMAPEDLAPEYPEKIYKTKYTFLYQAHDGSIMRPESFLNINKGRTLSSSQLRVLGITKIKLKQGTSIKQHEGTSIKQS